MNIKAYSGIKTQEVNQYGRIYNLTIPYSYKLDGYIIQDF